MDIVFPVDKILHRPMPLHWLSLPCFWSNLVTSVDLQLPAFIILCTRMWDIISHFHTYRTISYSLEFSLAPNATVRLWVSTRNQNNYTYSHFCFYSHVLLLAKSIEGGLHDTSEVSCRLPSILLANKSTWLYNSRKALSELLVSRRRRVR